MNKVILIGTEHYNLLGLVRCFGVNGIRPFGIIISVDRKRKYVSYSKYWEEIHLTQTIEDGIDYIIKKFKDDTEKPVLIPCVDNAEQYIDNHLDTLTRYFLVENINNVQGAISLLMNKEIQVSFVRHLGFDCLDAYSCNLQTTISIPTYPVILKPVTSAEGQKNDICIVNNDEEFRNAKLRLIELGYSQILIQKFLNNKKEYVISGAVGPGLISYSILENIRQWPSEMGTGCYSLFSIDNDLHEYSKALLKAISEYGYTGPIDIEFFKTNNGKIYINEINWRSSGRNFISQYTKVYSVYLWYRAMIGQNINSYNTVFQGTGTVMTETSDINNILTHKVSVLTWVKQFINANCHALLYSKDLRPAVFRFN